MHIFRSFLLLIAWGQVSRCKADKTQLRAPKTMHKSVINAWESIYDQPTYKMRMLEQGQEVNSLLFDTQAECRSFIPPCISEIILYQPLQNCNPP